MPNARYEKILEAFGGNGYFCKTPEEIQNAMKQSISNINLASLVNVMISTTADRRAQVGCCKASHIHASVSLSKQLSISPFGIDM